MLPFRGSLPPQPQGRASCSSDSKDLIFWDEKRARAALQPPVHLGAAGGDKWTVCPIFAAYCESPPAMSSHSRGSAAPRVWQQQ